MATGLDDSRKVGYHLPRRQFLKIAATCAVSTMALPCLASSVDRTLAMRNLHTGERIQATYWSAGRYLDAGLNKINELLRDHRRKEVHPIAPKLLDALHELAKSTNAHDEFHIISGYRSPHTNAQLRKKSNGVAKRSFHMLGQAVDVRLPSCNLSKLHQHALNMRVGGVGLYRRSEFLHLDVGPVRQWVG